MNILLSVIIGVVIAYITHALTIQVFAAHLKRLRHDRNDWMQQSLTWQRTAETTADINIKLHENNRALLELVEHQKIFIAKLLRDNKDVPARNN